MRRKYLEDLERDVEFRLKSMKDLVLTTVVESEQISSFYMKKPGDRLMSTLLTFGPEGIVIQGDHVPEGHGVCSCPGYGLEWFISALDTDYLCKKFLEKVFIQELAVKYTKQRILDARRCKDLTEREARDAFDTAHQTPEWDGAEWVFSNLWSDLFGFGDTPYWYDYSPPSAIGLVAIQRKFAELYRARCETLPREMAK